MFSLIFDDSSSLPQPFNSRFLLPRFIELEMSTSSLLLDDIAEEKAPISLDEFNNDSGRVSNFSRD